MLHVTYHSAAERNGVNMSRESYALRPHDVEVFPLAKGTDIILRKNVEKTTRNHTEEGGTPEVVWGCDEVQCRTPELVTAAEVKAEFDAWWNYAENYKDEEAERSEEDKSPSESDGVSVNDRLDAIEAAILEIAEVNANG